jgi:hypothetical protein
LISARSPQAVRSLGLLVLGNCRVAGYLSCDPDLPRFSAFGLLGDRSGIEPWHGRRAGHEIRNRECWARWILAILKPFTQLLTASAMRRGGRPLAPIEPESASNVTDLVECWLNDAFRPRIGVRGGL